MILFAAPADSSDPGNNPHHHPPELAVVGAAAQEICSGWPAGRPGVLVQLSERYTTRSDRRGCDQAGGAMKRVEVRDAVASRTRSHSLCRHRRSPSSAVVSAPSLAAVVGRSSSSSAPSFVAISHHRRPSPSLFAVFRIAIKPSLKTARSDRVRIPFVD